MAGTAIPHRPMGRRLLASWSGEVPRAGLRERIQENFRRHRPRF